MRKSGKILIISMFFNVFLSLHAASASNYVEEGLALAGIPFDIAAHHYATTNKKKTAALLYLATDTINILNKFCCLYNNRIIRNTKTANDYTLMSERDFVANTALALRDIEKWYLHFKDCLHATNDELVTDEQTAARLAYAWQVVVLPCLKGLTACALAAEQSNQEWKPACYPTTAIHALTKLLDEYAILEKSSPYKKWLAMVIIVNLVWLLYEFDELKNVLFPNKNSLTSEVDIPASAKQITEDTQSKTTVDPTIVNPVTTEEKKSELFGAVANDDPKTSLDAPKTKIAQEDRQPLDSANVYEKDNSTMPDFVDPLSLLFNNQEINQGELQKFDHYFDDQ